jgi:hypothetical protein
MTLDKISAAGLVASLFLVVVLGVFIVQNSFPAFLYASSTEHALAPVTQPIGEAESNFMWFNRNTDLIAQAFVLFAAAAGCLAILRIEENESTRVKSEAG